MHAETLDEKVLERVAVSIIRWSRFSFTIKAVNLSDLSALVIPPQECDPVRPLGFQYQEVGEGLQTVVPSVDKVPLRSTTKLQIVPHINESNQKESDQFRLDQTNHENVVCVWDLATGPEQLTQIVKLETGRHKDTSGENCNAKYHN